MWLNVLLFSGLVGLGLGDCPHQQRDFLLQPTLKKWSMDNTWMHLKDGRPQKGDNVIISTGVLLDESPPPLYNITIEAGGSLVFDPNYEIHLKVANIHVYGSLEIGSEDCPYQGKLTITLTGTRESHVGETTPKVIQVYDGGAIEIHGEPKRSWTKLTQTVKRSEENENIYFDHLRNVTIRDWNDWVSGIAAYTFEIVNGLPVVKSFGVYDIHWHYNDFMAHLKSVKDGDILMMASQRYIRQPDDSDNIIQAYDNIEWIVYGEVTNTMKLRDVDDEGETWAFVYQKGVESSFEEVTNPFGVDSIARYSKDGFIYSAESYGHESKPTSQWDNFRIGTVDDIYPKIQLVDDVTTWVPGDRLVLASTDYDMWQAEEVTVALCEPGDCAPNEVRIDALIHNEHFGQVVHGVDMRGEVAVINRKVLIEGEVQPECPDFNDNCEDSKVDDRDTFGGHIKILEGYGNARIENVELKHMGQQTDTGRYPIHFHMCFDKRKKAAVPYVKGCSIHESFARCLTIHGTHGVLIKDNACYLHAGHGYFLEDGGEKYNTFDGNLAINTVKGTGLLEPEDRDRPASFWITNPLTYFVNNVAAGGEGNGIWFLYPEEPLPPSREFNLMDSGEAKRTMILEFSNNVAHSQNVFGLMIGGRLDDERDAHCCNRWQPLEDPKDPDSDPIMIPLSKVTGYKNRHTNIWIEGGLLNVTQVSVADSANGMTITNEGQQGRWGGRVSHAIVIGESENKGQPNEGFNRSLPSKWDISRVQSGVTMWKGPTKFSHIWFTGFTSHSEYDIAAIAKKRSSPYFFSILNAFSHTTFAFQDGKGAGNIAISGDKDMPGWENNQDGELISGFTYDLRRPTTDSKSLLDSSYNGLYYVVKPHPLVADPVDCALRPNWRLAICTTKYGNLRVGGDFHERHVIFVRNDLPSAQLEFETKLMTGPQVVLDGSRHIDVHFPDGMPDWVGVNVPGLDKGDTMRVGVCTPRGAPVDIQSFHPYSLHQRNKFTEVFSLAELDAEDANLDGKKYFYNTTTGMMYYKFVNTETRHPDETNTCNNRDCPDFRVRVLSGDYSDSDCRKRVYTKAELSMPLPQLTDFYDTLPGSPEVNPPQDYGAGLTKPFPGAEQVDGAYNNWALWSSCSKTCGQGARFRTRQCNSPMPENGGASCVGGAVETEKCQDIFCPINGELSDWSEWSKCMVDHHSERGACSGYTVRTRTCDDPPTQYGGIYCEGMTKEIYPCTDC